jgi:hypothetical protein
MKHINTRFTVMDEEGNPIQLKIYESYVWLPRGTIVKHEEKEYVVDSYRINISKGVLDIIVINK